MSCIFHQNELYFRILNIKYVINLFYILIKIFRSKLFLNDENNNDLQPEIIYKLFDFTIRRLFLIQIITLLLRLRF